MNDTTMTVGHHDGQLLIAYPNGTYAYYPDNPVGLSVLTADLQDILAVEIELLPGVPQNLRRLWDKANSAFSVSAPWAQDVQETTP